MAEPVVREIDIDAAPETVFAFFVEPAKLTRWLADEAVLDPCAGGVCVQVHPGDDRGSDRSFHMSGRFVEVDPPRRVVFTWGFTEPEIGVPPDSTTVEVTLRPNGSGTRVRLVHHDLPSSATADHEQGWTEMLRRLDSAVTAGRGADGQAMRHEIWIEAPQEAVFAALTTREGLDGWWGRAVAADAEVGGVVEFDHGFGVPLRMRVTDLVDGERVEWTCLGGFDDPGNPASDWGGTRLSFDLTTVKKADVAPPLDAYVSHDEFTVLRFEHAGWAPGARWFAFCSTAWAVTLESGLKTSCQE
ncbi:SRPBCC domain-containing protein [Pseudonocardia benzenivorans]|uniref:SRPBCC domain-containing protein n=1 Tax=Pseudonocardia benzenivorans TaxID=228005 RepID=A0ABW3VA26_9PSEU